MQSWVKKEHGEQMETLSLSKILGKTLTRGSNGSLARYLVRLNKANLGLTTAYIIGHGQSRNHLATTVGLFQGDIIDVHHTNERYDHLMFVSVSIFDYMRPSSIANLNLSLTGVQLYKVRGVQVVKYPQ